MIIDYYDKWTEKAKSSPEELLETFDNVENHLLELEQNWRENIPTMTENEWLQEFPEEGAYLLQELKEEDDYLVARLVEINTILIGRNQLSFNAEQRLVWYFEMLEEEKNAIDQRRLHIAFKEMWLSPRKDDINNEGITAVDILNAKAFPINQIYPDKLRKKGRFEVGLCPFHSEKTGSFFVYLQQNSWYCYSECIGGDSIEFVMKLKGITFPEAVRFLTNKHALEKFEE